MLRISQLQQLLQTLHIDGLLVSSEANISYLSGFTGDSSRLFISKKAACFVTDGRYTEQATQECHPDIEIFKWIDDDRFGVKTYLQVCENLNIKQLGIEEERMMVSEYLKLVSEAANIDIRPVSGIVEKQRLQKDKKEIASLRKACEISVSALEKTLESVKPGISESDIANILEFNMKKLGSEGISFDTIVLSGERTSLLHGQPSSQKIKKGDFLLFDFGAVINGYHADISRTFVVGKASLEQKEFYEMLKTAQQKSVAAVRTGVDGAFPDAVVRENLSEKYLPYYYPGLGHGVGLEIHELPFIRHSSKFTYLNHMCLTIEPGCYIPGWGGMRIEDTIVVKDQTPEILTSFPRDLTEL